MNLLKRHHPKVIFMIRLGLGLIFFTAGMSKLYFEHQFPGLIGPVWLEERLAEHGLGLYGRFIGISQIIVGILLFTQRFATIGAILCFPIILNIFMVTISLQWQGTPYVNAFLVLLNLWLLAYDYHKLKYIFTDQVSPLKKVPLVRSHPKSDLMWALGVISILVSVPLSYVSLQFAWGLCFSAVILIILNEMISKKLKNNRQVEETS